MIWGVRNKLRDQLSLNSFQSPSQNSVLNASRVLSEFTLNCLLQVEGTRYPSIVIGEIVGDDVSLDAKLRVPLQNNNSHSLLREFIFRADIIGGVLVGSTQPNIKKRLADFQRQPRCFWVAQSEKDENVMISGTTCNHTHSIFIIELIIKYLDNSEI